jgi:ABC-type uncharacterized transport system substrate-binding protein
MGWRLPAWAGLLCLAGPVAAHPHGRIDCQAQVAVGPAGLASIALQLTLDAQSSAALVPRLQFDGQGQLVDDKPVRQFADLVAGMFRQSGWLLQLRALGADGEPGGPALELADPGPARFSRHADGQVVVAVQLQPEAAAISPHGWKLACLDPTWYWATGFAGPAQFSASAPCQATLAPMRAVAEQAQALQAAALRAGVLGADQAAPGLLSATGVRAPSGTIRCPAQ